MVGAYGLCTIEFGAGVAYGKMSSPPATRRRRTSPVSRWIGSIIVISLLLLPVLGHAEDDGSETQWALADLTDDELVAMLASTRVDEALRALAECIGQYSEETPIDEVERLIPEFRTALGDDYIWGTKNSILKDARRYAEEGQTESVKDRLRHLPDILSTGAENAVREARYVLEERALRYGKEDLNDDAERLTRLLLPVVEDSSLPEWRRLEAVTVLDTQARFDTTPDAVFDIARRLVSEDSSAGVRRLALQIVHKSRRRDAIGVFETASRVLLEDPSVDVRYTAVQVLKESRLPEAEAIPFLEKAVLDERNTVEVHGGRSVRREATWLLGECGPEAAALLLGFLSNDTFTPEDRDVTIRALGRTGSADVALPELLKLVETGDETETRSAVVGLGLGLHEYPADARSTIMDVLHAGIDHPDVSRRGATCTAMMYTGDFHLIRLIEPLLDDPLVRADAQSAIEVLQSEMTHYRQMMDIPEKERDMSVDELIDHMGQEVWACVAVRLRCRSADDMTRHDIFNKLATAAIRVSPGEMSGPRGSVAVQAIGILGEQREYREEVIPVLRAILNESEDLILRDMCYSAVGKVGGTEAIGILKEAILEDRPQQRTPSFEGELRRNRFLYLGGCGPDAASALFEIAEKLDYRVDKDLLWSALGATGNESVGPFLLEQARTASSGWSRSRVLRAACIRPDGYSPEIRQQVAEMLVQDANSDDARFRKVAAWGLGVIGDETHIPLLERMAVEDPDSTVVVGGRGQEERYEKEVYPVREVATKSIENIRRRLAEEQEAITQ